MAVTHLNAGDIAISSASSISASPTGSPTSGATVAVITWRGAATISTVKHGSSGPDMTLVTGSNGSVNSGTDKKNAATYVYPNGSSPAGAYVTFSATVSCHISVQLKDGVDQTTPASGGFYVTGFDPFSVGFSPNTLAITKSSIAATATDDQVIYGGWCECNALRTMLASSSSTADAEISDRLLGSIAAAGYYEQADSSSETATITFSTLQYYSTVAGGYYGSDLEGIISGCVIEAVASGGGTPYAAELTAAAFGMTPAALNRISDYLANLSAPAFNLTPQAAAQSTTYSAQLSAPAFSITPEDVDARYGYVAALTAAGFALTAQALNRVLAVTADLTAAVFSFAAETLNHATTYTAQLTAPAFNFTAEDLNYENSLDYTAQLTAAAFGMSGEDLAVLRAYIVELTAAAFNIIGKAVNILSAGGEIVGKFVGFLVNLGRGLNR